MTAVQRDCERRVCAVLATLITPPLAQFSVIAPDISGDRSQRGRNRNSYQPETVEIFVEADFEPLPVERRRFALPNIPRHLFSEAIAATAQRAAKSHAAPQQPRKVETS